MRFNKPHRQQDAVRAGQQTPGLVGRDLDLPDLDRAALDLEGDLVLAGWQIDLLAVRYFGCGGVGVRQFLAGVRRQLDGLVGDGDDRPLVRLVAEHQLCLPRPRQEAGIRDTRLAQRKFGDCPVVLTGKPDQDRSTGRREGDHGPVRFDHRLDPATLAELGAIEAEHSREIARGLGVD